jgi:hypothetical protein
VEKANTMVRVRDSISWIRVTVRVRVGVRVRIITS